MNFFRQYIVLLWGELLDAADVLGLILNQPHLSQSTTARAPALRPSNGSGSVLPEARCPGYSVGLTQAPGHALPRATPAQRPGLITPFKGAPSLPPQVILCIHSPVVVSVCVCF